MFVLITNPNNIKKYVCLINFLLFLSAEMETFIWQSKCAVVETYIYLGQNPYNIIVKFLFFSHSHFTVVVRPRRFWWNSVERFLDVIKFVGFREIYITGETWYPPGTSSPIKHVCDNFSRFRQYRKSFIKRSHARYDV